MIREHRLFSTCLAALFEDPDLLSHIPQLANDFFVAVVEGKDRVRDVDFAAELHD